MNTLFVGPAASGKTFALNALAVEAEAAGGTVHRINTGNGTDAVMQLVPIMSKLQDRENGRSSCDTPLLVVLDGVGALDRAEPFDITAVRDFVEILAARGQEVGISVALTAEDQSDARFIPVSVRDTFTVVELAAA